MSPASGTIMGWTDGGDALLYERCRACGSVHYFRRGFCPVCGSGDVQARAASGAGTIYAVTEVMRAPSPELRGHAPYMIALVDARDGFRFMAHAAEGLAIGDSVTTRFRLFGGANVPFVERSARHDPEET